MSHIYSMIIFVAFLKAVQEHESILIDAHNGITRCYLEVIKPRIYKIDTPKNGEVFMAFGAQIRNSDFGDGALQVSFYEML